MAELQRAWAAHMRDGFTVATHQFEIEAGLEVVASAGWLWQIINRHERRGGMHPAVGGERSW